MNARKLTVTSIAAVLGAVGVSAQIPDLVNALDAGGRAMGMGGGIYTAGADTMSGLNNPAGLGFLTEPQIGLAFRNLPESSTRLERDFRDPLVTTDAQSGTRALSHAGLVIPLKRSGGRTAGTVSVAYTLGGFIRDERTGTDLRDGNLTVRDYFEISKIKTDYFTLSYGAAGETFAWGIGAVLTNTYIRNTQFYNVFDGNNNGVGNVNVDNRGNQTGLGGVVGVQFIPRGSNLSIGLSYRTPIDLRGAEEVESYYDRIPGKLSGGFALRSDGLRGGNDFLVYGAQVDAYFGGKKDAILQRKDQVAVGGGFEYNYRFGNSFIPFRLGYRWVPSGGDGFYFGDRETLTFGFGYRPFGGRFSADLNFATTSDGGGWDVALGLNYRLGN